jgi:hypothetical protein
MCYYYSTLEEKVKEQKKIKRTRFKAFNLKFSLYAFAKAYTT